MQNDKSQRFILSSFKLFSDLKHFCYWVFEVVKPSVVVVSGDITAGEKQLLQDWEIYQVIYERQKNKETERQRDRETGRQGDRETERQSDRETERQRDRKVDRQKNRKTERQKDRKTERQKDRKTEREKGRKTERRKYYDRLG